MEKFWTKNLKDLLNFLMIIIIILGFIGNIMSFRVFSSPKLKKHAISIFFRFISIFDLIMIINGLFYFISIKFDYDISIANEFFCKFKNYLVYTNGATSPWLMAVVLIERFICIRFPKRFSFCYKLKFQLTVIFTVIVYNYLFYSFMTWNTVLVAAVNNDTGEIEISCEQNDESLLVLQWMDFFNSTIIPFIVMLTFSILLMIYMRHSSTAQDRGSNANESLLERDNTLATSVIKLNFIFVILSLPIAIYDIIDSNASFDDLIGYTIQVLYYAFYSIGFYAHLVVNAEYRTEFLRVLNLRVYSSTLNNNNLQSR